LIYYKELSEKIIGLAIDVHKELGNGFLEKVYENALLFELTRNNIDAKQQHPITVIYKGQVVGEYFADILIEGKIILELKTIKKIEPIHEAQLLHYLKATNIKVGYILNFGSEIKLEFKRMVN
jgi:GxxExxY protein